MQCPKCERWAVGPQNNPERTESAWSSHELESSSLLAAILKRWLQQQQSVKILEAGWIWTEPHSRRLKLFVDLERLVLEGRLPVRQRITLELVVRNLTCPQCLREASEHQWSALLQLRHPRGGRHVATAEEVLRRHGVGARLVDVSTQKEGMDLFFGNRKDLEAAASLLATSLPCAPRRAAPAVKVVGRDSHTSRARAEAVVRLELLPYLRRDLLLLPPQTLAVVTKVASSFHISTIDLKHVTSGWRTSTLTTDQLTTSNKFTPTLLLAASNLRRYIILDINEDDSTAEVMREDTDASALGSSSGVGGDNDTDMLSIIAHCPSFHLLRTGEVALGYDIKDIGTATGDESAIDRIKAGAVEIILVGPAPPEDRNKDKKKKKNNHRRGRRGGAGGGRIKTGEEAELLDGEEVTIAEGILMKEEDTVAKGDNEGDNDAENEDNEWEDMDEDEDDEDETMERLGQTLISSSLQRK